MSDNNSKRNSLSIGTTFECLVQGFKLALSKECRAYVIIPVLVNLLLLSIGGYFAYSLINDVIFSLREYLPDYLMFLLYLLTVIAALMIIFVCCYFFSTIATIIASPFYGLLADKAEMAIKGTQSADASLKEIIKDIPRILKREFSKQCFFLPRALLCLIISVIPGVNLISPVPWFLLGSWMGCLQYVDYAYDNHKVPFKVMREDLKSSTFSTFFIGAVIAICLAIPLLNLIIPPAAVCAGTKYYVELRKNAVTDIKTVANA